jgi:DHA1 family bicyclomycin/chloramphenicol resistance-like MFS transporter
MTTLAEPVVTPAVSPLADRLVGRRYLQLVLVLGALSAIGPLTIDTYLPALPTLTAQLGATDVQAQATITGLLVGLGLGQLVLGPVSDAVGRRKPLLMGLAAHGAMSVLCAVAPSITMLTITRTLQGVAGAAVAVVAMAMVRDLFTGFRAAQLLSRLILVLGVAPILAPSLGSLLLRVTAWQGIFVFLAVTAVALLLLAFLALPETLPPERRIQASVRSSLRAYAGLFSDATFLVLVAVSALLFGTIFAYVAGSPFILQGLYGLSPQQFGLAFSANAVGLIIATQINPALLRRFAPLQILSAAAVIALGGGLVLLATALTGFGGLAGFMIPLWITVAGVGLSFPNAPAVALSRHGEAAGTASALLGAAQFLVGGLVAPMVGALDDGTAVPLAAILVAATGLATLLLLALRLTGRAASVA